jgi:hypothetical protein
MKDEDLIAALRRAASIWFKNTDLLLLEEFIRRFERLKKAKTNG